MTDPSDVKKIDVVESYPPVQHTFIHFKPTDEAENSPDTDDPLMHTMSDQTGIIRPLPLRLKRQNEDDQADSAEASEEEEDEPLARTKSVCHAPAIDQSKHDAVSGLQAVPEDAGSDASDADAFDDSLKRLQTKSHWPTQQDEAPVALNLASGLPDPAAPSIDGGEPYSPYIGFPGVGMPMLPPWYLQYPGYASPSWPGVNPNIQMPAVGQNHRFHTETQGFGTVTPNFRVFTKDGRFNGRLSVVSEAEIHSGGVHHYLMQFTCGELAKTDGVGFVFNSRLPCAKNIQKICSIFVNVCGNICIRNLSEVEKASESVRAVKLGDWIEMSIDLQQHVATFKIWPENPYGWGPPLPGCPESVAQVDYSIMFKGVGHDHKPPRLHTGHFACVIKNSGVQVTLCS